MNNFHILLAGPVGAILPSTPVASAAWDIFLKECAPGGIFLGIMLLFYLLKRRTQANLHTLAERLGYEFKPASGSAGTSYDSSEITGIHQRRPVRFFSHRNPGETNRTWMAVAATIETNKTPAGAFLYVAPNTLSFRVAWRMGPSLNANKDGAIVPNGWDINWNEMKDLSTGDDIFDRAFLVKTNNPEWAQALLTYEVRQTLLAKRQEPTPIIGLQNDRGLVSLRIEPGEVRYSVPGDFSQTKQVEHLIAQMDFVCELAAQTEVTSFRGLISSASQSSPKSKFLSVPADSMGTEAKYPGNDRQRQKKVKRVIAAIVITLVLFLLNDVVPEFEKSYDGSHATPPAPMQYLIEVRHFLGSWWWALLLGAYAFMRLFIYMTSNLNKRPSNYES